MPLLKCQSSKSTPQKVMAYVTDKNKAEFVSVRNLFEDEDYAEQFEETAKRFGKGEKFEERKYYHFKLSCDRKDTGNYLEDVKRMNAMKQVIEEEILSEIVYV